MRREKLPDSRRRLRGLQKYLLLERAGRRNWNAYEHPRGLPKNTFSVLLCGSDQHQSISTDFALCSPNVR